MKRQHTDWEKIFANNVTNKGLVSKTYKQLLMLNINKTKNPIEKWTENLDIFPKKTDTVVKKHMKSHSASLIVREMQIKTNYKEIPPLPS